MDALLRSYLFTEALAFNDYYYETSDFDKKDILVERKPLTWSPFLFHATKIESFLEIIDSGFLEPKKGSISLSALPIKDIDRLRGKDHDLNVVIAFPRRLVESFHLTSVLYLSHNEELKETLKLRPEILELLAPYIEIEDDLGAFNEIRIKRSLPIKNAYWILFANKSDMNRKDSNSAVRKFENKYGNISCSLWHHTHQTGVIDEYQYIQNSNNLDKIRIIGEHYFKEIVNSRKTLACKTPLKRKNGEYRTENINFLTSDLTLHSEYEGPYHHIDTALILRKKIYQYKTELIPDLETYSLIETD